jgi:hypothetical protein
VEAVRGRIFVQMVKDSGLYRHLEKDDDRCVPGENRNGDPKKREELIAFCTPA